MTSLVLRHARLAIVTLALSTVFLAAGMLRLTTDVGYRAFLGVDHPAVRDFDAFLERFGGGLPMMALWSCAGTAFCHTVFDASSLKMAHTVEESLRGNAAVLRVTSPASASLLVPTPLGASSRHFFEHGTMVADAAALAARAVADPLWVGRIISSDAKVGAIVVDLASSGSRTAVEAYAALDAALAPFEADGVRFSRVGGPVEFVVAGEELNRATLRIVPVMVALVGLTLFALFRSVTVAAAALLTVGVAVLWTLGALGWIGWAQNSLSQTLAPLILVIGVCDGIHLISSYARECAAHPPQGIGERRAALERVSADVGTPCVMTSLTTAAGFLSFATADLRSFVDYGIIAAVGVMFALVLSFSFLPLLLLRVEPDRIYVSRASAVWERGLGRLVAFADNRRQVILACSVVLGMVCSLGMARLRVDSSFEELYGTQSQVVRWAHFVSRHLRKPDALEVDLQLPPDAALEAPATLAGIRRIAHDLSRIAPLGEAHTVLDLLAQARRLAFGEAGGDGAAADAEENAALLEVASETGTGQLSRWVDAAHRHVRVSIASEKLPQDVLRRVMAQVRRYLRALPPGWGGTATGPLALVSDMLDAIRTTQLRSFAAAAVAVAALLALYLRSITWTALALFPTALPVVVTLGVMGWMNLPLDIGSAMVAAVVLGIAVDDIIHLLHHIRRARRAGESLDLAVRTTIRRVGQPVVTTSVALTIGFAALILSPWRSVASFGLVSAIAIAGALVADLLVLPALMFVMAGTSHTRSA